MPQELQFDVRPREGSCFAVNGSVDDPTAAAGTLLWNIYDQASQDWVSVVVDQYYPPGSNIITTPHMKKGDKPWFQENDLQPYTGVTVHVTRWAPGFLNIPGNGGGEIFFTLPPGGNVSINITVNS